MNEIRIQSNTLHRLGDSTERGPIGMAGCQLHWHMPVDESYTDGHIDYTHEL